jgi:hypothetical protein
MASEYPDQGRNNPIALYSTPVEHAFISFPWIQTAYKCVTAQSKLYPSPENIKTFLNCHLQIIPKSPSQHT